ncbi:hypothetical protein [Tenacibaculum sp. 190524A02b]|uniref:Roadblock/LAMTOR2 domain-containing protein n=1 Tax=Tenacibaculum vairaonense TaxID=3137860 RepID=A0ABM9PKZ1_9FLAO
MKQVLDDLVKNVKENIPAYIGISVTDMSTGEALISHSVSESFDPALASAYNVEIINAKRRAIAALGLNDNLIDIHFKLESQVHIINIAPNGEYFVYLALDGENANLALARTLLNKYKVELNSVL